jgi:hypothetical protein
MTPKILIMAAVSVAIVMAVITGLATRPGPSPCELAVQAQVRFVLEHPLLAGGLTEPACARHVPTSLLQHWARQELSQYDEGK